MFITYKYRIKGKRAIRLLKEHARAVNQVWNYCVTTQKKIHRTFKDGLSPKKLSHYAFNNLIAGTSKDLNIHAQSSTAVCAQFTQSRDLHKKCPKYRKSFGTRPSLGWIPFPKQARRLSHNSITYLGNTYYFFGAKKRPLPIEDAKGGTFFEDASGKWYVAIHIRVLVTPCLGVLDIGVDLGLKTLAATSDGRTIINPSFYKANQNKLAIAQRAKNKKRTRSIHTKIKNARADFLHKEANKLLLNCKSIFIGNVSSLRLAQTKLAKTVYDVSWGTFKSNLQYKASRHGIRYLEVNESFTTQTCSSCLELPASSPKGRAGLGIRNWVCSSCGATHDRDVNSAKNILRIGRGAAPLAEETLIVKPLTTKEK